MTNVDSWGAKEWFERLREAVVEHDKAVVEAYMGNPSEDVKLSAQGRAETFKNIVVSSAFHMARDYGEEITAKLSPMPIPPGTHVIYVAELDDFPGGRPVRLQAEVLEPVEGWYRVKFGDGGTAIVRPSKLERVE